MKKRLGDTGHMDRPEEWIQLARRRAEFLSFLISLICSGSSIEDLDSCSGLLLGGH